MHVVALPARQDATGVIIGRTELRLRCMSDGDSGGPRAVFSNRRRRPEQERNVSKFQELGIRETEPATFNFMLGFDFHAANMAVTATWPRPLRLLKSLGAVWGIHPNGELLMANRLEGQVAKLRHL